MKSVDANYIKYKKEVENRLQKLTPYLQKIAMGNFKVQIDIPEREDEFTELLVTLNLMVDELNVLQKERNQKRKELENLNKNLEKEVKKRSRKLTESEKKFRMLFENMVSGVAIYKVTGPNTKFVFTDVNRAALKMDNKRRKDLVGKDVKKVFPGVENMGLYKIFKKVYQTGKSKVQDEGFYSHGKVKYWRRNYVYKLPTGEIVAIYDDLTREKQQEQKLKESEERFSLAMKGANDGLSDWDIGSDYMYYSPRFLEILGLGAADIKKNMAEWKKYIAPGDVDRVSNTIDKHLQNKKQRRFELKFKMITKNKMRVLVLMKAFISRNKEGQATRMVCTYSDITESELIRQKLEEKVVELEKLNQFMIGRELKMVALKKKLKRYEK